MLASNGNLCSQLVIRDFFSTARMYAFNILGMLGQR